MAQLEAYHAGREGRQLESQNISGCGAVGSVLAWGARGRQFESGHPDIKKSESESVSEYFHSFFSSLTLTLILFPVDYIYLL